MTRPHIVEAAVSLAVGLVFGLGLIVSGMANPAKVLGFLDLFGSWDPSLALVMASAVGVGLAGFAFSAGRTRSVLGLPMKLPGKGTIDRRLAIGALVFGAGWGLAGFCPGPALVAVGEGSRQALVFTAAMVAGMLIFELTSRRPR